MWVKDICAYTEGVGDVVVDICDSSSQVVESYVKDVQYVLDMGQRAGFDKHRLFTVINTRDVGHRIYRVRRPL